MKVLVVDDDPDILEVVTMTFTMQWHDCTVITASNGEDGLRMVEQERPDAVVGSLTISFARREVSRAGTLINLTPTEFNLLYLVRNAGQVLPHATLLAKVWGHEYVDEVDYLKVYVRRLREKIEDDPQKPRLILTERGVGYRFAK